MTHDVAAAAHARTARAVTTFSQLPPGEGRAFVVDGVQVALFRGRDGRVHALGAVCPHAGGPIADGQTDAEVVICPLHAHVFELDGGACRTGQPALPSYAVSVAEDGTVWVTVA